jgi:hypothetical protein
MQGEKKMANEKRLIDANALLKELDKFINPMPDANGLHFISGLSTAITEIDNAPTEDAVEVVLCKDCEHYECDGDCECWGLPTKPDDFCSHGERRYNDGQ